MAEVGEKRKRGESLDDTTTGDEREAKRLKRRAYMKDYNQRKKDSMTAEQREVKRLKACAYANDYTHRKKDTMTAEQKEVKQLTQRAYKQRKKDTTTAEQQEAERLRLNARVRDYIHRKKDTMTAEQHKIASKHREEKRIYARAYYARNKEDILLTARLKAKVDSLAVIPTKSNHARFLQLKNNATKRGIVFELTEDEFAAKCGSDNGRCWYCNVVPSDLGFHLDRVNNGGPYVADNLVISCWPCNRMKSNDRVRDFVQSIYNIHVASMLDKEGTTLRCGKIEVNSSCYDDFPRPKRGCSWDVHVRAAKERNLVNDMTHADHTALTSTLSNCTYCSVPGSVVQLGVDRVDSDIGYTLSNVAPACWRCNKSKSNMPVGAFQAQCAAIFTNLRVE